MSASVLYMSMSVDGYIAGPHNEPDNPGGDGFDRLHEWFVTADGEGYLDDADRATQLLDRIAEGHCGHLKPAAGLAKLGLRNWPRRPPRHPVQVSR